MKTIILIVLLCSILGAVGQLFFKLGSKELGTLPIYTNWKLALGLALYGCATILFVSSLRFGNLSYLYPLLATNYIWVTLLSKFVLNEPIPSVRIIGIIVIIIGVGLIAR